MEKEESDFKKKEENKFNEMKAGNYQRDILPNERDINLNTQNDKRLRAIISKLIPTLTEAERLALYKSYVNPLSEIAIFSSISDCRKKALSKLCESIQKQGIGPISRKNHLMDESTKHSEFKKLIDAYLSDELTEDDKAPFEEHMLDCDFCGDLLLLNRDIINVLIRDGKKLFAGEFAENKLNPLTIDQSPGECILLSPDTGEHTSQNKDNSLTRKEDTKLKLCPGKTKSYKRGKSIPPEMTLGLFFALPLARRSLPLTQRFLLFSRLSRIFPCSLEFSQIVEALLRFL